MAAQQAVFDTYELLEMIILQLPGHHVPHLQLISRAWKEFINSSSAIRRHYNNGSLLPVRWSGCDANIPIYDETPNLKLHPFLRYSVTRPDFGLMERIDKIGPHDVIRSVTVRSEDLKSARMIRAKESFATKPPCQYLNVFISDNGSRGEARYAEGGLKVGDLLDVTKEHDDRRRSWPYGTTCSFQIFLAFKEDTTNAPWWKR